MTRHHVAQSLFVTLALIAFAPMAQAQFVVSKLADTNDGTCDADCSFREAWAAAIADPGANGITFSSAANGTITLGSNLPDYINAAALSVTGNGPALTQISGADTYRLLQVTDSTNFRLSALTLADGNTGGQGGGLFTRAATVLVQDVVMRSGYAAFDGGGMFSWGGNVTIERSTFVDNTAHSRAGGFGAHQATVTMSNVTLSGNTAQLGFGSGICFQADVIADLNGITVTRNSAAQSGVVLLYASGSQLTLRNSLIVNGASKALLAPNGQFVIAGSHDNLISSVSGVMIDGINGNRVLPDADLPLAPLGDFGGSTPTHALLPGIPALDAAGADAPVTDQRGFARVGTADIGAFESRGFVAERVLGNAQSARTGAEFAVPLAMTVTAVSASEPVEGGIVRFSGPATGAGATFDPSVSVIDADGLAFSIATANGTPGGPYVARATLPGLPDTVFALTNLVDAGTVDLSIEAIVPPLSFYPGDAVAFELRVSNAGPQDAVGATMQWIPPAGMVDVAWTCTADAGAACAESAIDGIFGSVSMPVGRGVTYFVTARLLDSTSGIVTSTATVVAAANQSDPTPADASVPVTINVDGVFRDGLESAAP